MKVPAVIVAGLVKYHPGQTVFTRAEVRDVMMKLGRTGKLQTPWLYKYPRVDVGTFDLTEAVLGKVDMTALDKLAPVKAKTKKRLIKTKKVESISKVATVGKIESIASVMDEEVYIPKKATEFVRWGHFSDLEKIIASRMFFPVFVTGLSGNGKTFMVEQACAEAKRHYVRVQITPETDEDDLIGGFRLVGGETVFAEGPVIKAMKAGAILLIDEIDRGSNKLMALQGVLEGKPVLLKKTGEVVAPAAGFNVIATANTKGQGSDDGKYIAATILDEAFLERFNITMEQPYASDAVEKKILLKHMEMFENVDENFADVLVKWSTTIRKTFMDGGCDDLISTRRLCHIVQTEAIFKDRKKAVALCTARFNEETKAAFADMYDKIDAEAVNFKADEEAKERLQKEMSEAVVVEDSDGTVDPNNTTPF